MEQKKIILKIILIYIYLIIILFFLIFLLFRNWTEKIKNKIKKL
jgi:magnesium-transporting ATPase (P-type)